jgi:hypothetical protein
MDFVEFSATCGKLTENIFYPQDFYKSAYIKILPQTVDFYGII